MALLNVFKKDEEPKKRKKPAVKKSEPKADLGTAEKQAKEKNIPSFSRERKKTGISVRILKEPHITEKATDLTKYNQYVFRIFSNANKSEVKKAVEETYGVDVVSVGIINVRAKERRMGRIKGTSKGYKKAIVKIKEGQKIELLPR